MNDMERGKIARSWFMLGLLVGFALSIFTSCEVEEIEEPACYEFLINRINAFYYDGTKTDFIAADTICPKIINYCNITTRDIEGICEDETFHREAWFEGVCIISTGCTQIILDSVYIVMDQTCEFYDNNLKLNFNDNWINDLRRDNSNCPDPRKQGGRSSFRVLDP